MPQRHAEVQRWFIDQLRLADTVERLDELEAESREHGAVLFMLGLADRIGAKRRTLTRAAAKRAAIDRVEDGMPNDIPTWLQLTPPDILWHYTPQHALPLILQSQVLWASESRYLNDSQEYLVAHTAVCSILDSRLIADGPNHERLSECRIMMDLVNYERAAKHYVACLSAEPDDLSQWRAYGGSMGAYAIGFRSGPLLAACNIPQSIIPVRLARAMYSPLKHRAVLSRLIDAMLETPVEEVSTNYGTAVTNFLTAFVDCAAVIKHHAFAAEKEWRLIAGGVGLPPHIKRGFRSGSSSPVPYAALPLIHEPAPQRIEPGKPRERPLRIRWPDLIDEIIVGPSREQELAVEATRALLREHGLQPSIVSASEIPYRNW
jgi:hypothetical protein